MTNKEKFLIEALSVVAHEVWCDWSQNLVIEEPISKVRLARWKSQWVEYDLLPEEVKKSDRVIAAKYLEVIKKRIKIEL